MEVLERIISNIGRYISSTQLPSAASATCATVSNIISRIKLRPLTKDNILYYYVPLQGLGCYTVLSVAIMNPQLIVRMSPHRDITNILLLGAGGGAGMWLWSRPHFAAASPTRRFSWAFLGGTLWPLGSILMWAILRNALGKAPITSTLIGVASGATLTYSAIDYFHYLEVMFCGKIHLPEDTYNSEDEKYDNDLDL